MKDGLLPEQPVCGAADMPGNVGVRSRPLTKGDIENVSRHPIDRCVRILFSRAVKRNVPNLVQLLEEGEREVVDEEGGEVYAGVIEGIPRLSQQYRLYLISNCRDWYLDCFFRHSRLGRCFSDSDCHGRASHAKSEMIRQMLQRYHLHKPIYIGDTIGDRDAS